MIDFTRLILCVFDVFKEYVVESRFCVIAATPMSICLRQLNKISEKIIIVRGTSVPIIMSSRAENNGKKSLHEVLNLYIDGIPFIPEVMNLNRRKFNEISRGWLKTCTAGIFPLPEVKVSHLL